TLSKDRAADLSLLLYHCIGTACLELGNYVPEKAEKAKYLHRGKDKVDELLKLDPRNLDAWELKGLLLEDIGAFVAEPEKYYKEAVAALGKAMDPHNLMAGKTKPWLARGRVGVKWAELLPPSGKEFRTQLIQADSDLKSVLGSSKGSADA